MPPRQQRAIIRRKRRQVTAWNEVGIRTKMYCILDRVGVPDVEMPTAALFARTAIFAFMIFVTVLLTFSIIVGSLPQYVDRSNTSFFYVVEMLCVLIFTVDWVARLIATPHPLDYLLNALNVVDLLGLLPFWLEVGGVLGEGISQWFLVLRVTRLVRALMFLRNFNIIVSTIEESTEVGMLLIMIVGICLPVFGTSFYYAERGVMNNVTGVWERPCAVHEPCEVEISPFQSAVDGMWFTMSTITTLGFGDLTPKSDQGKIIAAVCMCVGVFLLSFPVMILAVNFEHEKQRAATETLRRAARDGRRLQSLQVEHTLVNAAGAGADGTGGESGPSGGISLALPRRWGFFVLPYDKKTRMMRMTAPGVCRYEPLLTLARRGDGTVRLTQRRRNPFEFKFTLVLGSEEADNEAKNAMNLIIPSDVPAISRATHFLTTSVSFALEKPRGNSQFLKHIRLLKAGVEEIDEKAREIEGAIELLGFNSALDEQKLFDVCHSFKRCRLRVTAAVAHDAPTVYDVPLFFDALRATNFVKELVARRRGVIFVSEAHAENLLRGVHHLIKLPQQSQQDGGEMIINTSEITRTVTKEVLRQCATECHDPAEYEIDDFLYGEPQPQVTYYGVFVHRLLGGRGEVEDDPDEDAEHHARDQRVLVNLHVLAVNPHFQMAVLEL